MELYKERFITFLAVSSALQFGDFTLKSGRQSPYFINTGLFNTGKQIRRLGEYYAEAIKDHYGDGFDYLYGPAYKGIPLCVATAASLASDFGIDKGYTFNRKEAKDHGDKKILVGHQPSPGERAVIIDDVITDGGALIESVDLLNPVAKPTYIGVMLSVNRMEKTKEGVNAVEHFEEKYGMPIHFIVTIQDILEYLTDRDVDGTTYLDTKTATRIKNYLKEYGV